jgi:hypothetical protein
MRFRHANFIRRSRSANPWAETGGNEHEIALCSVDGPTDGIPQPDTADMEGRVPQVTERRENGQITNLNAFGQESRGQIHHQVHGNRPHRRSRDMHPGVGEVLETFGRQLVTPKRGRGDAFEPARFDKRDHELFSQKGLTVSRCGRRRCESQNARAVTREEIQKGVRVVDRPYQWAIEPVPSNGTLGQLQRGAWNEDLDSWVFAEVVETHAIPPPAAPGAVLPAVAPLFPSRTCRCSCACSR